MNEELEKLACWNKLSQSEQEDLSFFFKAYRSLLKRKLKEYIEKSRNSGQHDSYIVDEILLLLEE